MAPDWLTMFADIELPLAVLAAVLVTLDIFAFGRRQKMGVMEAVWPLTMLYWGPPGLIFYAWFGRAPAAGLQQHRHGGKPMWQACFSGATHCGAGCAFGDFIGDWLVFAAGLTLFGSPLVASFLAAFLLAYAIGIVFQYFSVAPMQGLGLRDGIVAAIRIDTLSLLAYEIGMFAVMALRAWMFPHLAPTDAAYWLLMQVAMVAGFITTYPVNWWLIRAGIKERM